jgi:hypothetical protein
MTDQAPSLLDDIAELGAHIQKAPKDGDYRKERAKLGEKHHRTIKVINELVSSYLRGATSPNEYQELQSSVGSFLT